MLNEKIFLLLLSQPVNAETVNFVFASVLSTLVIKYVFTGSMDHRFGNSIDQSERT